MYKRQALDRELGGTFVVFYDVTDLRRLETLRRDFVARVKEKALGTEVAGSLNPGQALVGICLLYTSRCV